MHWIKVHESQDIDFVFDPSGHTDPALECKRCAGNRTLWRLERVRGPERLRVRAPRRRLGLKIAIRWAAKWLLNTHMAETWQTTSMSLCHLMWFHWKHSDSEWKGSYLLFLHLSQHLWGWQLGVHGQSRGPLWGQWIRRSCQITRPR